MPRFFWSGLGVVLVIGIGLKALVPFLAGQTPTVTATVAPGQRLNQMLVDRQTLESYHARGRRWLARLQAIERHQLDLTEGFLQTDRPTWAAQVEDLQRTKLRTLAEMRALPAPAGLPEIQASWERFCDLRLAAEALVLDADLDADGREVDPDGLQHSTARLNEARAEERRWEALVRAARERAADRLPEHRPSRSGSSSTSATWVSGTRFPLS